MKAISPFKGRMAQQVLIILLFLPLLFLNNRYSHDWGDDFAQYIHQAKNIVEGLPQSETGFVYSQENYIGPTAYPSGFPLLLSPVYALFGNRMIAFTFYLSLFYLALALLVLKFYRNLFSTVTAIILTVLLVYNPQLILFKQEVMSDLPFTLFLVLAFLVYPGANTGDWRRQLLFGLITGFLMMIRSVGFVLLLAVAVDLFIQWIRQRRAAAGLEGRRPGLKPLLQSGGLLVFAPLLIYYLVNSLIFKIPSGGSLQDYLKFYYSGNFLSTIPANLEQYVEVFRFMYTPVVGGFRFIALITGSLFLVMSLLGFLRKLWKGPELFDLFFIFYLFILLVFPNNYSAYRLLIPVGFLLVYYAALGFRMIRLPFHLSGRNKALALGIFMLALFLPGIINVTAGRKTMLDGPQQPESISAFYHISQEVSDTAVIVFFKPRALALYSGRKAFADPFTEDPTSIHVQITEASADYILVHQDYTREPMKRYLRVMGRRVDEVWKNRKFNLYRILPPDPSARY